MLRPEASPLLLQLVLNVRFSAGRIASKLGAMAQGRAVSDRGGPNAHSSLQTDQTKLLGLASQGRNGAPADGCSHGPLGRLPAGFASSGYAGPPSPTYPRPVVERFRNAASRLAAELDDARLYRAAAYASMAADAIDYSGGEALSETDLRTDVDLDFELDEHGRIWMIRQGDCHIIGRADATALKMLSFAREVLHGRKP
jgi:hypothetical protein